MKTRHLMCSLLVCMGLIASAQGGDDNLIVNSGLESAEHFDWYGASAVVSRVQSDPHSGLWCLYVQDGSSDVGQGNNAMFAVRSGQRYHAEAWVRTDGDQPGTIVLDVQFYDADGNFVAGTA